MKRLLYSVITVLNLGLIFSETYAIGEYAIGGPDDFVKVRPDAARRLQEVWQGMKENTAYYFGNGKAVLDSRNKPLFDLKPSSRGLLLINITGRSLQNCSLKDILSIVTPKKDALPEHLKNANLQTVIKSFLKDPSIQQSYEKALLKLYTISDDSSFSSLRGQKGVKARRSLLDNTLLGIYSGTWLGSQNDFVEEWQFQDKEGGKGLKEMERYFYADSEVTLDNLWQRYTEGFTLNFYKNTPESLLPYINSIGGAIARGTLNTTLFPPLIYKGLPPVVIFFTEECVPEGFDLIVDYQDALNAHRSPLFQQKTDEIEQKIRSIIASKNPIRERCLIF